MMGHGSRLPNSNDLPPADQSRFGGNELADDFCLLLNGLAKRCVACRSVTRNEYLQDGKCPDCRPNS